ncbi:hypothetical protein ATANTOWER_002236 [Ataeniobius toweri]|uniref:Uncharacterized protein n=1 Tax=Ataeniobius toweri TaxID=208326 RepID=A0ABU7CI30_9TELE|nr:hypothetical protein [Ataeniobius toweri]
MGVRGRVLYFDVREIPAVTPPSWGCPESRLMLCILGFRVLPVSFVCVVQWLFSIHGLAQHNNSSLHLIKMHSLYTTVKSGRHTFSFNGFLCFHDHLHCM